MGRWPSDLETIDNLRAEIRRLHGDLDALRQTVQRQAARISDLERLLQAQLDGRPA